MGVKYAELDALMRIVPAAEFSPECPKQLGRAGMTPALVASADDDRAGDGDQVASTAQFATVSNE